MIKLTPLQKRVLGVISSNCRASVSDVAGIVSARSHQVRYIMDRLSADLNLSPYCFSNPFRSGLVPYQMYFSMDSGSLSRRTKISSGGRGKSCYFGYVYVHEHVHGEARDVCITTIGYALLATLTVHSLPKEPVSLPPPLKLGRIAAILLRGFPWISHLRPL